MISRAATLLILGVATLASCRTSRNSAGAPSGDGSGAKEATAYHANVVQASRANTFYRRVIFTGPRTQLVLMTIPPGEDVGEEQHRKVEQLLFCAAGSGRSLVNGIDRPFEPGDVIVLPPGVRHNVVNNGAEPLQIYTVYSPPNHLPGRAQRTKAEAMLDVADNAFGEHVEGN